MIGLFLQISNSNVAVQILVKTEEMSKDVMTNHEIRYFTIWPSIA